MEGTRAVVQLRVMPPPPPSAVASRVLVGCGTLTLTLLPPALTRAQTHPFVDWRVSLRMFPHPNPNPGSNAFVYDLGGFKLEP